MSSWRDFGGLLGHSLPSLLSLFPSFPLCSFTLGLFHVEEAISKRHPCKYFPEIPGSVLRMAPSCCVTVGKPIDLSGLQTPIQVRGMDQVISFGSCFSASLCPEARLSAPRKDLFPVILPRVEVSPQLISALHLEASGLEV